MKKKLFYKRNATQRKEYEVEPTNTINPDHICQRALQAKMETYKAKEHFEAVLKMYNDEVENLIQVIGLMKSRILELEKGTSTSEK